MKITFALVSVCTLLLLSGCVQSESFLGSTEIRQQGLHAMISPSTVPENVMSLAGVPRYDDSVGHPASYNATTGMTLEIRSLVGPIQVTNFQAEYEFQKIKMGALGVPYTHIDGPVFQAYLVPEATRLKLNGGLREIKKGVYNVTVRFDLGGEQKMLVFEFDYQHTSEPARGPIIMPWQN